MRIFRIAVLTMVALGGLSMDASAQLRKSSPAIVAPADAQATWPIQPFGGRRRPAATSWSTLRSVARGSSLEVNLKTGRSIYGTMDCASLDDVTVRVGDRLETIRRDEINHVWHRRTRAVPGAVLGAVNGLVAGALMNVIGVGDHLGDKRPMAIGAAIGAVVGGAGGASVSRRILVY